MRSAEQRVRKERVQHSTFNQQRLFSLTPWVPWPKPGASVRARADEKILENKVHELVSLPLGTRVFLRRVPALLRSISLVLHEDLDYNGKETPPDSLSRIYLRIMFALFSAGTLCSPAQLSYLICTISGLFGEPRWFRGM